jgi:hypothetical protein
MSDSDACPFPAKGKGVLGMSGTGLRQPGLGAGMGVARNKQSGAELGLWWLTIIEAVGYAVLAVFAFIIALVKPHKYDAETYWSPQDYTGGSWVTSLRFVAELKLAWLIFAMSAAMALVRTLQVFGWMRATANNMVSVGRNPMRNYIHGIFVGGMMFVVYYIGAGSHIIEASAVWVCVFRFWSGVSASEKLNPPSRGTKGSDTNTDWSQMLAATLSGAFTAAAILANFGYAIKESSSHVPIWAYIVVIGTLLLGLVAWIVNVVNLATSWFRSYFTVEYIHRIWSLVTFYLIGVTFLIGSLF